MTFDEFLRQRGIMNSTSLNKLAELATQNNESLYVSLRRAVKKFHRTEMDLMKLFCEYNDSFKILTETKGMLIDKDAVISIGGIAIVRSLNIIPLKRFDSEDRIVIFNVPDSEYHNSVITNALGSMEYQKYICDTDMWLTLWNLHIVPLEIAAQAKSLSEAKEVDESHNKHHSEIRLFYSRLISVGFSMDASDVHFVPRNDVCDVKYRIDGRYRKYTEIPNDMLEKICNILKQDGNCKEVNRNQPVDGKVKFTILTTGQQIDLRFSIIPSKAGPDLNVRYLSNGLMTFEQLGMNERNVEKYKHILEMPQGLVVQVGPTGSGKTTTLYSGLNYIKDLPINIITIEDPVEISLPGITQIDVDSSREEQMRITFADALKASLRHDPDVIVVGEMRDTATAEEALRAATTGHLVLASLHTNDSIGVLERLKQMGIDSYSLGEVLVAVMGQRLVRRLCPHCKEEYIKTFVGEEARMWGIRDGTAVKLYRPIGCENCNNTGYKGRVAINEIMEVDTGLRDLIQKHALRSEIESYLSGQNSDGSRRFISMFTDGRQKVLKGITSLEEMSKMAADKTAFKEFRR